MSAYKNFEHDFIQRTLKDIDRYSGSYEVTALINSCVGLLVIPKEKLFEQLPTSILNEDKRNFGINKCNIRFIAPEKQELRFENYDEYNIRNVVTHMRNAVAHGRIQQESICEGQISSLEFKDEYKGKQTFEAVLSVDEFRSFAISIANEVLKSK